MREAIGVKQYIFPVIFIALCILGNSRSHLYLYLAFFSVILEIFFNTIEESFAFSFFLISNIRIMDDTGYSFLVNVLIVLPLIKYLVFRKMRLHYDSLAGALCFFVIEGLHVLAVRNFSNIPSEICWLLAFVLCSSILFDQEIVINKRRIVYYLVSGTLASSIVYLSCHLSYARHIIDYVLDGSRFTAYADDPNFYSLYLCVSMAIIFSCRNKKVIDYLALVAITGIGLLTASKMCFLLMIFIVIATIFFQISSRTTKIESHFFMLKIVAIIIAIIFIFKDYALRFLDNFNNRAGLGKGSRTIDLSKLTTGRSVIVTNYLKILSNNMVALIFGYGFQYGRYLGEETKHVAHNTYLDCILSWGIIGTIFLIHYMLKMLRSYRNRSSVGPIGIIEWLPLITLLINFFDLGCLSATMFWFMWTAAVISLTRDDFEEFENNILL